MSKVKVDLLQFPRLTPGRLTDSGVSRGIQAPSLDAVFCSKTSILLYTAVKGSHATIK
jgi:hypothetical protein